MLGALLETVPSDDLDTVTQGYPESHDFVIGVSVARTVGVRHTAISSHELEWTTENLIEATRYMHLPVPMASTKLPAAEVYSRFGPNRTYWSGYLGDALAGAHLPSNPSETWDQAVERFLRKNRVGSPWIAPTDFDARAVLPPEPLCDPASISMDDQLDLGMRQRFRIRARTRGIDSRSPFSHPRWSSFMLALPHRLRFRKPLYKDILASAFPDLFRLPIESNYGVGLGTSQLTRTAKRLTGKSKSLLGWRPRRGMLNIRDEIMNGGLLHQTTLDSLHHLDMMGIAPWINYDRLWQEHQERQENHAKDLSILLSLSINIGAMEKADSDY